MFGQRSRNVERNSLQRDLIMAVSKIYNGVPNVPANLRQSTPPQMRLEILEHSFSCQNNFCVRELYRNFQKSLLPAL